MDLTLGDTNIDLGGGQIINPGIISIGIGSTLTFTTPTEQTYTCTDGKIKVIKDEETIFIGKEYNLIVNEGETYKIIGVESTENDYRQIKTLNNGIKNIIVKRDGYFDKRINILNNNSFIVGCDKPYDSRFKTQYIPMGVEHPGYVQISDFVHPDWSRVRPAEWAKSVVDVAGKSYAEGILYPKRNDVIEPYEYNFILEDMNGEIKQYIPDEIHFSEGIKLKVLDVASGFSNSLSTFITTTLIIGDRYPTSILPLFGLYSNDGNDYVELGMTETGYMKCNSRDVNWIGSNNTYKFNLNTTYEIQFGYINGAYLLRLNGSDNAKFSRTYNNNSGMYFTIGTQEQIDCDVRYSFSNTNFIVGDTSVWHPSKELKYKKHFNIVGTPNIENGILSNLSTSNYIISDINALDMSVLPYELNFKFTTGNNVNAQQIMFEGENGFNDGLRMQIYQNHIRASLNVGGSWIKNDPGYVTIQPNTTYWYKVLVTESQYVCTISTDGIEYVSDMIFNTTSCPSPKKYIIGNGETSPMLGTIDLNETYILRNGKMYWKPLSEMETEYINSYKIYTVGEKISVQETANINGNIHIENGIASNFANNNYISLPSEIFRIPMEMYFSFTTGSDVSSMQNVFHKNGFEEVFVNGGNLKMWSSSTSEVVITSVSPNTKYWLKIVVNQQNQVYYVSTTGHNDYSVERTINDTGISVGTTVMKLGGHNNNTSNYWRGSIDFNHTYMMMNGNIIWTPFVETEIPSDVYGLCTKDFVYTGQPMLLNAYKITYIDDTFEILLGENEPNDIDIKSVELIKSNISIGQKNDFVFEYDKENERFASSGSRLEIVTQPTNATVVFESDGYMNINGNICDTSKNATVNVTVSSEYYKTKTQEIVVSEDMVVNIQLEPNDGYIDVYGFETTLTDGNLILSTYSGNKADVVLPNI